MGYDPTGPRTARLVLRRIVNTKPVAIGNLRSGMETLEESFREYAARANEPLPESLRMAFLEQLLCGNIATHVDLNYETFPTYDALRHEVWKYAERIGEGARGHDPMQVGGCFPSPEGQEQNKTLQPVRHWTQWFAGIVERP